MTYYIKADAFYYPYQVKPAGYLEVKDGCFGEWREHLDEGEVLDYTGFSIAPGLVDTHVHGYNGADVMDLKKESFEVMSRSLLETGVTSFLPTALTASFEDLETVCRLGAAIAGQETGARIQGIYFEGPYFTEKYKGAQNPKYMRNPSQEELDAWLSASQGLLKKIAVAPEREGVEDFISYAKSKGVVVALGHSDAHFDEAVRAVEAGASVWVHAYNGMSGLNHREPGMVGAVYALPHTYAELICDGHHVHPSACSILMQQKGYDQVALITDCMRAGGLSDGDYMLGEYPVIVSDGTARLKEGGSLAGSILKLKDGVKNVVSWGLASPLEAIRMATYIPALSMGLEETCGQLKKGLPADFIVLTKELDLAATYLSGEKVYEA